jgi:hypothetical protein
MTQCGKEMKTKTKKGNLHGERRGHTEHEEIEIRRR